MFSQNLLSQVEITWLKIVEILLSGVIMTTGFSFYSGKEEARRSLKKYAMLFAGIVIILFLSFWLKGSVQIAFSAIAISGLYVLLFREHFLDLIVILIFALVPYYLLIPLVNYLLLLVMPVRPNLVSLIAHGSILVIYLVIKMSTFKRTQTKQISPMINILALIIVNIVIYAVWYLFTTKFSANGEGIPFSNLTILIIASVALNLIIIMNFLKTESKLELLKNYNELKMTVVPLVESNIDIQKGFTNHLCALSEHVDIKDKRAKAYIKEVIERVQEENEFNRWEKQVVAALMIRKKQEAAALGITLKTQSGEADHLFAMPDYLLISVLTNIVDCGLVWTKAMNERVNECAISIENQESLMIRMSAGDIKPNSVNSFKPRLKRRCRRKLFELKRLADETDGKLNTRLCNDGFVIEINYKTNSNG